MNTGNVSLFGKFIAFLQVFEKNKYNA